MRDERFVIEYELHTPDGTLIPFVTIKPGADPILEPRTSDLERAMNARGPGQLLVRRSGFMTYEEIG